MIPYKYKTKLVIKVIIFIIANLNDVVGWFQCEPLAANCKCDGWHNRNLVAMNLKITNQAKFI